MLKRRITMSHVRRILFIILVLLFISGCAWQRIPPMPAYTSEPSLPIRVGVIVDNTQTSTFYGPGVLEQWKQMRLFDEIIYPYREGDNVDCIMKLSINGGWKGSGFGAGFVIGLTFGLAGTAIGPSMTGTHEALAVISKSANEAGRYSVKVESEVEWGMAANTAEVSDKANQLQRNRIAFELAQKIRADRKTLLSALGK
jgi:hypothetical protein